MKDTATKKTSSTVQQLREIRDNIGTDIQDLSYEQLMKYIQKKSTLHSKKVWQTKP